MSKSEAQQRVEVLEETLSRLYDCADKYILAEPEEKDYYHGVNLRVAMKAAKEVLNEGLS